MLAGGYDIALQGDRAVVADWGTVRILDIADPFHPYLLGTYYPGYAHSYIYAVEAAAGYAYFTDWDAFCVLDITDPTSPTLVTRMGGAVSWGEDLLVKGGVAVSASGQYGLRTIDLSDTNVTAGMIPTPGLALNLADQDNLVLAALGDGGLGIFSFGQYSRATIPSEGGSLVSPDASVSYDFPAGVFSQSALITHTVLLPSQAPQPPAGMRFAGPLFSVEGTYVSSGLPAQPAGAYTLTVRYDPQAAGPANESSLGLYSWDGNAWNLESAQPPDTALHRLQAQPDHFSVWAVFGEVRQFFLPLLVAR
jgi:hypothetical protein